MPSLYSHQIDAISQLLAGKHIIIAPTGVGKGAISVKWAEKRCEETGKTKILVVTTASKAHMEPNDFEEDIRTWCKPNFLESLDAFKVISWAKLSAWVDENWGSLSEWAIIFDECLPADTKVMTDKGEKELSSLTVGDRVLSYNHSTHNIECKTVTRVIKKKAPKNMYRLLLSDGTTIVSTGNHPHYTQDGYKNAKNIKKGDTLYEMYSMWEGSDTRIDTKTKRSVENKRESLLFQRMWQNVWNKTNEKTMARQKGRTFWRPCEVHDLRKTNKCERTATAKSFQLLKHKSILLFYLLRQKAFRRSIKKGGRNTTQEGVSTNMDKKPRDERRKWQIQCSTEKVISKIKRGQQRLGDGTSSVLGAEKTRIPNALQARYRQHLLQNRGRVRWSKPQQPKDKGKGQEEGEKIRGVRVESVEVLKLGDIKRHKLYRDPDNVYCIDVEDNHNFFANGVLTHNCAYAKAGVSSQRGRAFLKIAKQTPDWSGYTATPGETWLHHYPYFQASGLIRNKTSFLNEYATIQTYKGYPEIVGWRNEDRLKGMWAKISYAPDANKVLSELPEQTHKVITFSKPKGYSTVLKTRQKLGSNDPDDFLDTTMGLCHYLRQLCFTKEKQEWIRDFVENLGERLVIFYSYIEEGEQLEKICKKVLPRDTKVWRIDGRHHEIPTEKICGERDVVLCQWQSGSEGINLQYISIWLSVSPTYSYSTSIQARGRVRRIGSKKPVFYYYLKCENCIENDVYKALKNKQDFAEKNWCLSNNLITKGEENE